MRFATRLYTDGSSCAKTKAGGWGYVIVKDGTLVDYNSNPEYITTNNRMEVLGAIQALRHIDSYENVEVHTDSIYVVDCFKKKWYKTWRKENWISAKGLEIKNRDLWEQLLDVVESRQGKVFFYHIKGHAGDKWNEMAHDLATEARKVAIRNVNISSGNGVQGERSEDTQGAYER